MFPKAQVFEVGRLIPNGKMLSSADRKAWAPIRENIEQKLATLENNGILIINLLQVNSLGFSPADELIAQIVAKLDNDFHGNKYLLVQVDRLSHQREIHMALERRKKGIIAYNNNGWLYLGKKSKTFLDTLKILAERMTITAGQLTEITGKKKGTSSTHLNHLYQCHVARRLEESLPIGGRQYTYHSLLNDILDVPKYIPNPW